jgi:ATP-binding cassette subfamily B protein
VRETLRGIATMVALAVRADWRRATAVAVLAPVASVSIPLMSYLLKVVTDGVVDGDLSRSVAAAAALGVMLAAAFAAGLLVFTIGVALQERTDLLVDQRLVELTASIPTVEHHERPEYLDRLEVLRRNRMELTSTVRGVVDSASALIQLSVTAVLLVTIHPALAVLPLVGVPSLVIAARTQRRIQQAEDDTAENTRRALHLFDLATSATAGKELRVFRLGDELTARYHELWTETDRIRDRAHLAAAVKRTIGWAAFALGYVGAMLLVAREAAAGRATAGDVMMALGLAANLNMQVAGVAATTHWLLSALKTVGRFLWLLDYSRAARPPVDDPAPVPDRVVRGIELDGVRFRYPGTDTDVLTGVDLFLPAGSTLAVVGDNGAGKTSLVKLLARLYEPTEGAIRVDGVDLARMEPDEWRLRLSGCFQDAARLELRVSEAVGVGHLPDIEDQDAVGTALARAGAADVVDVLPSGLDTQLGPSWEAGVDLSGGQWQKVALGRAMMRDAPLLLVLDEPTSALDADTEHALFDRYHRAARAVAATTGGITVLVSHRFSTVRMADLIVVIDGGRVVEAGSHDDLVARAGLYAELYELQARAYR